MSTARTVCPVQCKATFLSTFIPAFCQEIDFSSIKDGVNMYLQFLPGDTLTVEIEFLRWKTYRGRQQTSSRPNQIMDAPKMAVKLGMYPCLAILLHILATLPVTSASSERSFSALKYIKNYLRSMMSENRLNGLVHLYVHRDIKLNYDQVGDDDEDCELE